MNIRICESLVIVMLAGLVVPGCGNPSPITPSTGLAAARCRTYPSRYTVVSGSSATTYTCSFNRASLSLECPPGEDVGITTKYSSVGDFIEEGQLTGGILAVSAQYKSGGWVFSWSSYFFDAARRLTEWADGSYFRGWGQVVPNGNYQSQPAFAVHWN